LSEREEGSPAHKNCATYPQRFPSGTSGGGKLNRNRVSKVHVENVSRDADSGVSRAGKT